MIESYSFGKMKVDGKVYTNDLFVFSDHVESDWWRKSGHNLNPEDLEAAFSAEPDVLVVGTGNSGMMSVPDKTKQAVREKGIDLIVETTKEAWQTYNRLSNLDKKVVGAFHLTC